MNIDFRQFLTTVVALALVVLIFRFFFRRKIRTAKFKKWCIQICDIFHEHQYLNIPEFNENYQENNLYRRVSLYLNSLESIEDSDFTNLVSGSNPTDIILSLNPNQKINDRFLGAHLSWVYSIDTHCYRSMVLKIRKRDKRRVLRPYLQHIYSVSNDIIDHCKEIRLYTNFATDSGGGRRWKMVKFTHPATMETLVMDNELKTRVKTDLETFMKAKQYYNRLGRVWRRSYLLYGPSGTGKSSFVAAMAKTLSYDVYDLDLSKVSSNLEMKMLLLQTTPRSIILVEDFDRYINNYTNTSTITLSGILNFMDGVVNNCCDERIMVFTMAKKDNIEPEILRPGRVDVHIYFPLCDFNNFKNLAGNYLGLKEHKLFPQVEEIFQSGVTISPAEISELMLANRNSPNRAIKSVITALQTTSGSGSGLSSKMDSPVRTGRVSFDETGDPIEGGIGCRDGVKEIGKLYGLFRRKSFVQYESFNSVTGK